ncbi:MAG: hypothetical protein LBE59_03840, partial [Nevskiaceae bacterium]|nr:hypothetical protein [Nevskiaceae bacterium]
MKQVSCKLQRIALAILFALFILPLTSCAKKAQTEEAQLADLRDGFIYKRYRDLSGPGVPLAMKAFVAGMKQAGQPVPDFAAAG